MTCWMRWWIEEADAQRFEAICSRPSLEARQTLFFENVPRAISIGISQDNKGLNCLRVRDIALITWFSLGTVPKGLKLEN